MTLSVDGLPGDEHVYEHHGGPDMALLAYSNDHYNHWRQVHGLDLPDAAAWGENLTVDGLTETEQMAKLVQESGYTGYLSRVLQPGVLAAGEVMVLVEREDHGVTVAEAGRVLNVDRSDLDAARRVLAIPSLGFTVRNALAARVARAPDHANDAARLYGDE